MKKRENEEYVKLGLTLGAVVAGGLLLFFFIQRFDVVRSGAKSVWRILRPIINGTVIAYLLTPLCNRLEKFMERLFGSKAKKWSKGVAILLAILAAIALVWLLVALLLPQLWTSIESIVNTYPEKEAALEAWFSRFVADRFEIFSAMEGYLNKISGWIQHWMEDKLLPAVQTWAIGLGTSVAGLLSALKDLLLGLLISAYMLSIRKRFAAQAKLLNRSLFDKTWADRIEKEVRFADMMFNGFLVGKLIDSAIIGVLCMIGVSIIGIGPSVLVSTIIGVTNIIPFFGPFIGAIPCALLILLDSPLKCLYFIIFIIALQQLDGNVIGPLILGDSTGLSSFWVMFAILFFGGIWGVIGMIVGVPLFAVLYDILRQILYAKLERRGEAALIAEYDETFHKAPEKPKRKPLLQKFLRKKK